MTKHSDVQQDNPGNQPGLPTPPPQGWLPAQRRDMILNLLLRDDVVRVPDLARMMSTTEITIRRDLDALSKAGLIRRVRGGALSLNSTEAAPEAEEKPIREGPGASVGGASTHSMLESNPDNDLYSVGSLMSVSSGAPAIGSGQTSRGTIGVVLPEPSFFWPAVTEHIRQIARDLYNMDIVARETSYEDYPETGILDELSKTDHLRGIIVAPSINPAIAEATWRWLADSPLPVTVLEREPPLWSDHFIDSVHTNHPVGVRKALLHFRDHGHTRIGLALGYTPTSGDIELGWRLMMQDREDTMEEAFLLTGREAYEADDVNDIADAIIRTGATAVLVHPDYLSIAVAQALQQRGKHVPQDVSLISIDGYTTPSTRPLTVLRSSEFDLAQSALRLLTKRMGDRTRQTEHVYTDPRLIDRGSVTRPHRES